MHDGLADMLRQVQQADTLVGPSGRAPEHGTQSWRQVDVDRSVLIALEGYQEELRQRGLDIELGEDGAYVAAEQMALVEGMLRAYAHKGLGELVERYEVLEVEREDVWHQFTSVPLHVVMESDTQGYIEGTSDIDLQARADALLRERSSGDLYILSFKTAASKDWRQDSDNRHDVQGLSEAAVVERRLQEWWEHIHILASGADDGHKGPAGEMISEQLMHMLADMPDKPRIMGIQMVYLYKGRRSQAVESGPYITESHLIRGWTREGVTDRDYAWRYKWDGPDTWPDTGRLRGHTLGKGWSKFDAWTATGGVKTWIDLLASGTVQPDIDRNPFDDTYAMPLPIFRQDRDMSDWIEQAQEQERRVIQDMNTLEQIRTIQRPDAAEKFRHSLNVLAPQYRRSCDFPSKCQHQEICWGDPTMLTSPCSTGLYQLRVPHHAPEQAASGARKP